MKVEGFEIFFNWKQLNWKRKSRRRE